MFYYYKWKLLRSSNDIPFGSTWDDRLKYVQWYYISYIDDAKFSMKFPIQSANSSLFCAVIYVTVIMRILNLFLFLENLIKDRWWKYCKYNEWVSFFLGSWGMNLSMEQTNCTRTASQFMRFVCLEIRFISHEHRKRLSYLIWPLWSFCIYDSLGALLFCYREIRTKYWWYHNHISPIKHNCKEQSVLQILSS